MFDKLDVEEFKRKVDTLFDKELVEQILKDAEGNVNSNHLENKEGLYQDLDEKVQRFKKNQENMKKLKETLAVYQTDMDNLANKLKKINFESVQYNKTLARSGLAKDSLLFLNERRFVSFCKALETESMDDNFVQMIEILLKISDEIDNNSLSAEVGVSPDDLKKIREKCKPKIKAAIKTCIRRIHSYFKENIVPKTIEKELTSVTNHSLLLFLCKTEKKLFIATKKLFVTVYSNFVETFIKWLVGRISSNFKTFSDNSILDLVNFESSYFFNSDFDEGLEDILKFKDQEEINCIEKYSIRVVLLEYCHKYLQKSDYFNINLISFEVFEIFKESKSTVEVKVFFTLFCFIEKYNKTFSSLLEILNIEENSTFSKEYFTKTFFSNITNLIIKQIDVLQPTTSLLVLKKFSKVLFPSEVIEKDEFLSCFLKMFDDKLDKCLEVTVTKALESCVVAIERNCFEVFHSLLVGVSKSKENFDAYFNLLLKKLEEVIAEQKISKKTKYSFILNRIAFVLKPFEHEELNTCLHQKLQTTIENFVEEELAETFPTLVKFVKKYETLVEAPDKEETSSLLKSLNTNWKGNLKIVSTSVNTFIEHRQDNVKQQCFSQFVLYVARLHKLVTRVEVEESVVTVAEILEEIKL